MMLKSHPLSDSPMMHSLLLILMCNLFCIEAFQPWVAFQPYTASYYNKLSEGQHGRFRNGCVTKVSSSSSSSSSVEGTAAASSRKDEKGSEKAPIAPQVLAAGYSQDMNMVIALQAAVEMALAALPQPDENSKIDLAIVSVSSIYDGRFSPSLVVPTVLEAAHCYGGGIQQLVGSTVGGWISSRANPDFGTAFKAANSISDDPIRACTPLEQEGVPGVSVVLCLLPDVEVQTFHVSGDDVPDDYGRMSPQAWRRSIGLVPGTGPARQEQNEEADLDSPAILLLPSPAFSKELDDLLCGMEHNIPGCNIFGAIASTVSSLSRARLFRHDANEAEGTIVQTLADGCVGVVMVGDIQVQTMMAQGAKPVGGVYQVVKGQECTISTIALDEAATELAQQAEEEDGNGSDDDNDDDDAYTDRATQLAQAYAKARIPKPVLAEANFVMRTLSDDDQSSMRKAILVGLSQGGSFGRTPSDLARLAEGKGHSFTVHQVATASMKDGSVTLSLGSVNIEQGMRMRFFVRESSFAKREVEALWTGYKRRSLAASLERKIPPFVPTGCFLFPTLDRGNKFFLGKSGFESFAVSQYLPTAPCISGFFSNGVIGALDTDADIGRKRSARLNGSATGYFLIGSKSNRPVYSPAKAAADNAIIAKRKEAAKKEEQRLEDEAMRANVLATSFEVQKKAPRDVKGELILKRREVNSGRALTVSTVEWSVQETMAIPSSTLEGFMWDKETEVDRFRERVPLANLVSQCKLSATDPSKPKPRDWIGPVKEAARDGRFVIIPECKRMEPGSGSLRRRYDVPKLVEDFTARGAPAICVNCDGILFGGSLEDLTKAREASCKAALEKSADCDGVVVPPILASDLLLYPYQLYKIRLAGADAVTLVAGALAAKDLVYLTKIAASLQMQTLLTVSSVAQIANLDVLPPNGIDGLIVSNRELEDFSFDLTGKQALRILESEELRAFREKHGNEFPVLVEGRVGLIQSKDENGLENVNTYLQLLHDAGATGAIVGGGLVPDETGASLLNFSRA